MLSMQDRAERTPLLARLHELTRSGPPGNSRMREDACVAGVGKHVAGFSLIFVSREHSHTAPCFLYQTNTTTSCICPSRRESAPL